MHRHRQSVIHVCTQRHRQSVQDRVCSVCAHRVCCLCTDRLLTLLLHTVTQTNKQTPLLTHTHPDMNNCTHISISSDRVSPSPAPPAPLALPAAPPPSLTWRSSFVSTERSTSTLSSRSPPPPPPPPPPPSLTWRSSSLSTEPEPSVSIESNNSRTLAEIFACH